MAGQTFNGKNVYVFGGSSGIGLETARLLAGRGAHIILFARNKERLDKAVEEVSKGRIAKNQTFSSCVLDVSDHEAVHSAVKKAAADFCVPQIVINTAGRAIPRHFEEISYA